MTALLAARGVGFSFGGHRVLTGVDLAIGAGEIVTVSRTNHPDLFRAFPNSYGTLGYSVRLRIELEPVRPFVTLRHLRFHRLGDLVAAMDRIIDTGGHDGVPVDYLDGVVFSPDESYLCVGVQTATPGPVSDYTGQDIYYRSIQHADGVKEDRLTIHDYLWRWDTDWFWCSRAFGVQRPVVRRLWPRRFKRSDVYQRLVGLENRHHVAARVDRWRGRPERERVVQDVEIPLERTAAFLDWFLREVPIEPIWLCPVALREPGLGAAGASEAPWPLYPMRRGEIYVNVGFWSSVPIRPGRADGDVNREIERVVSDFGGHKSLYSDAYYSREEFESRYGGTTYQQVKATYDPDVRFPGLYDKAVRRR